MRIFNAIHSAKSLKNYKTADLKMLLLQLYGKTFQLLNIIYR